MKLYELPVISLHAIPTSLNTKWHMKSLCFSVPFFSPPQLLEDHSGVQFTPNSHRSIKLPLYRPCLHVKGPTGTEQIAPLCKTTPIRHIVIYHFQWNLNSFKFMFHETLMKWNVSFHQNFMKQAFHSLCWALNFKLSTSSHSMKDSSVGFQ